jgi:hypothetical protein
MTEDTFTRELELRAGDVHGAPLSFHDVRSKARSIRRRRRAAVSVVAAAAVAAIVLPMTLTGRGDSTPEPLPSPTPSPSPSVELPGASGTSVLQDGVLTHPDGSTTPLDVDMAGVLQVGVLTDGRVVVASSKPYGVRVFAADGELESGPAVAINQITMSADDTLVAWYDENYRVVVLESGVTEPTTFEWGIPMPGEAVGSIDAVFGSDCASGGCTVLGGDGATTTSVLTSVTEPAEDIEASEPMLVRAASADGRQWAVTFPADDGEQFGCSGTYDPDARTVLARSCDATVWSYSPDQEHLTSARGDNQMAGSVEILDTDLAVVRSYEPPEGTAVIDWGWADSEHLLVVVAGLDAAPDWSIVRVPVDGGEPEVVTGPVTGPNPELGRVFFLSD